MADERFLQQLWQLLRVDVYSHTTTTTIATSTTGSSSSPGKLGSSSTTVFKGAAAGYPLPRAAYEAVPQLSRPTTSVDSRFSSSATTKASPDPEDQQRIAYVKLEILNRAASIGGAEGDAHTLYHSMKTAQEAIKAKNQAIRELNAKLSLLQSQLDALKQKVEKEKAHDIIALESLLPSPVLASLSPNATKDGLIVAVKRYIDELRHKSSAADEEASLSKGTLAKDDYSFHFDESDSLNGKAKDFSARSPIARGAVATANTFKTTTTTTTTPTRRPSATRSVGAHQDPSMSISASQRSTAESINESIRSEVVTSADSTSVLRAVIAERDAVVAENAVLKAKIAGLYKQKRLSNIALHEYN